MKPICWAYGVTTVPTRRGELLPRTLESLAKAGFDKPRLFVDGSVDRCPYQDFKLELTMRDPRLRIAGSWILALWELYARNITATHYAIFQDDLVASLNLRAYLEQCKYPAKGYWNLYTFPQNAAIHAGNDYTGWFRSNQRGLGAVALVFNREAVKIVLGSLHMIDRTLDVHRGHRSVDGGIVTAFKKAGWKEYVHLPSLVQHTGKCSTAKNKSHPQSPAFRGEQFDLLQLKPVQGYELQAS